MGKPKKNATNKKGPTAKSKGKGKSFKVGDPLNPPPPNGQTLPVGGAPGGIIYWDGFNWVVLPPSNGPERTLRSGTGGIPYWAG